MFKIATSYAARVILVIVTAGTAQSAPLSADLLQLDAVAPASAAAEDPGIETASYCTWVMTFEEETTVKPEWCDDASSSES